MLADFPPGLLDHWQAYYEVEPFGQDWLQTAVLAREAATGNAYRLMAAGVKDVKLSVVADFLPVAPAGLHVGGTAKAGGEDSKEDAKAAKISKEQAMWQATAPKKR